MLFQEKYSGFTLIIIVKMTVEGVIFTFNRNEVFKVTLKCVNLQVECRYNRYAIHLCIASSNSELIQKMYFYQEFVPLTFFPHFPRGTFTFQKNTAPVGKHETSMGRQS